MKSKQSAELVTYDSNDDEFVISEPPKSILGHKRKYTTDEERIIDRRAQQKVYRGSKKKELAEL